MQTLASRFVLPLVAAALTIGPSSDGAAQEAAPDGPRYRDGDNLVFPQDYRSWPFIGGGLGMTYADEGGTPAAAENPTFSHAFVNPSSYRHFVTTGEWPDRTVFVLEFRASASAHSINTDGRFATGLVAIEAEVKDSRFPDGWAYFAFGRDGEIAPAAAPLGPAAAERCVQCHVEHGAVERTFVQFYPTLLEIAREKGTLKPGFE